MRPTQVKNGGPRGWNEVRNIEKSASGARAHEDRTQPYIGIGPALAGDNALSGGEVAGTSSVMAQTRRLQIGQITRRSPPGVKASVVPTIWEKPKADCGVAFASDAKIAISPSKKSAAARRATKPARSRGCRELPPADCSMSRLLTLAIFDFLAGEFGCTLQHVRRHSAIGDSRNKADIKAIDLHGFVQGISISNVIPSRIPVGQPK